MPGKVIADHVPQFNGQEFEQFSVQHKLKDSTFVPFPPTTPLILRCTENHIKMQSNVLNRKCRLRF